MKDRGAFAALLLAGVLAVSGASWAQEDPPDSSVHPPKHLKLVGDHWTAWDSPEAGPDDYIIQKGDTLWDLAGTWLADPFLWPQVWDENRYILDSHWIYPGDPLVVPGQPTVVPPEGRPPVIETLEPTASKTGEPVQEEGDTGETEPVTTGEVAVYEATRPSPLVAVADPGELECSGYIVPDHTDSALIIADAEQVREYLAQGSVIYMNQGRNQGIEAGSEWAVIRPTRPVEHPETRQVLGEMVRRMGRVRVMVTQENTSTAVISMACGDIVRGDQLMPWTDIPLPLLRSMPTFDRWDAAASGGAQGHIVAFKDDIHSLGSHIRGDMGLHAVGTGHLIHTDLGVGTGVNPGDVLTVYRDNGEMPRINLGMAVVLTVEPDTSTAKIMTSVREVEHGDLVELVQ
jgi:hypothetical protein